MSGMMSVLQLQEKPVILKKPKKVIFPKRQLSVASLKRQYYYRTADKTTCSECPCFVPRPYVKKPKLRPCLQSPLTLYEIASRAVDKLELPVACQWSVNDVADWMKVILGSSKYRAHIIINKIDGRRLPRLEDVSQLPKLNIHDLDHIKTLSDQIRKLYFVGFIKSAWCIGLDARRLLYLRARTGPNYEKRTNSDLLRLMKIIGPKPVHLDHWDLVWYQKPEFPKSILPRRGRADPDRIPIYVKPVEECNEFRVPRKFPLRDDIPKEDQMIWMVPVTIPEEPCPRVRQTKKESRLMPKKINLEGLSGKQFRLARRLMPKRKFFNV